MQEYHSLFWILLFSINNGYCNVNTNTTDDPMNANSTATTTMVVDMEFSKAVGEREQLYLFILAGFMTVSSIFMAFAIGCFVKPQRLNCLTCRRRRKKRFDKNTLLLPPDDRFAAFACDAGWMKKSTAAATVSETSLTSAGATSPGKAQEKSKKSSMKKTPKKKAYLMGSGKPKKAKSKGEDEEDVGGADKKEFTTKHTKFIERKRKHAYSWEADNHFNFRGPVVLGTFNVGDTDLYDGPEHAGKAHAIEKVRFDDNGFLAYNIGFGVDVEEGNANPNVPNASATSILTASIRMKSKEKF